MIHYDRFNEGDVECDSKTPNERTDDLLDVTCKKCLHEVYRQITADLRNAASSFRGGILDSLPRYRQCGIDELPHAALINLLHEIEHWLDSTSAPDV